MSRAASTPPRPPSRNAVSARSRWRWTSSTAVDRRHGRHRARRMGTHRRGRSTTRSTRVRVGWTASSSSTSKTATKLVVGNYVQPAPPHPARRAGHARARRRSRGQHGVGHRVHGPTRARGRGRVGTRLRRVEGRVLAGRRATARGVRVAGTRRLQRRSRVHHQRQAQRRSSSANGSAARRRRSRARRSPGCARLRTTHELAGTLVYSQRCASGCELLEGWPPA